MKSTGILVTEAAGSDHAIAPLPTAVTAFVGRALRGPVNRPVTVCSFADYQQVFGGLWQPSTMSYAVEQFFENGGREAVVVRVVNGGAPATISLPCGTETLTLEALSPGSREVLRASIDYDNITALEEDRFNLVVQRVRALGSEHIEDQEIFRRVSVTPDTARFVVTALQESALVQVRGPVPTTRPDRTFRPGSRHPIGYLHSNPDGDDGAPLTDYDLIGSPERRTGLFALSEVDGIHFLCVPPPTRDRDVGPSLLLAAAQFCRDRHLMLVVDPPAAWTTCDEVLQGLRALDFRSDHALMCFPRIQAFDRLRGRQEVFPNCGAVAGSLARADLHRPLWTVGPDEEVLLRQGTQPAHVLTDAERHRLVAYGINPLQSLRAAGARGAPLKTLARGTGAGPDSTLLTARRRNLLVAGSIERGTRWARFEGGDRGAWLRLVRQVRAFLQPLAAAGIFGSTTEGEPYLVVCDERLNSPLDLARGVVNVLVSLRGQRPTDYQSWLITHGPQGSRLRSVRSNHLPVGTRFTVPEAAAAEGLDDTQPRRTVAQELFARPPAPRPAPSDHLSALDAEATAPRRRDLDLVTRLREELGRRGQHF